MKLESINRVAIIGTGMIGASMAALFTGNGYPVTLLAIDDEQEAAGRKRYRDCYADLIAKGLVTDKQAAACARLLTTTQRYQDIADADFIIESVFERLDVKHSVYAEVEKHCRCFKALASTTSAISPDDLAKGMENREKLVGAHPWNPPHLVPFIELVGCEQTAAAAIAIAYEVFESVGRKVVVMKRPAPGFIGNRLQHAMAREAVHMIEHGIASPEDIDKTLKYSFIPRYTSIGLFEHLDYAGLDQVVSVHDYVFPDLGNEPKAQDYLRSRLEAGDLGLKTGKGVYDWSQVDMDDFRKRAAQPYLGFFNWSLPEE